MLALRSAGNLDADRAKRISLDDLNGRTKPTQSPKLADFFGGNRNTAQIVVTRAAERQEYDVPREEGTVQ